MRPVIAAPFAILKRSHAETATWLHAVEWDLALTLTCKEYTTEDKALKTIRHFWNCVDRMLYKNKSRYGQQTKRACFIEVGKNSNVHFHILALTPPDKNMDVNRYGQFLAMHWLSQKFECGGEVNDIAPIRNQIGCLIYFSKSSKKNFDRFEPLSSNV